jgi:hypothetical protein
MSLRLLLLVPSLEMRGSKDDDPNDLPFKLSLLYTSTSYFPHLDILDLK